MEEQDWSGQSLKNPRQLWYPPENSHDNGKSAMNEDVLPVENGGVITSC